MRSRLTRSLGWRDDAGSAVLWPGWRAVARQRIRRRSGGGMAVASSASENLAGLGAGYGVDRAHPLFPLEHDGARAAHGFGVTVPGLHAPPSGARDDDGSAAQL